MNVAGTYSDTNKSEKQPYRCDQKTINHKIIMNSIPDAYLC